MKSSKELSLSIQKPNDYYGIENELSDLHYINDAMITDSVNHNLPIIQIVPNKYYPYAKIKNDVNNIVKKHGIDHTLIKIVPAFNYTPTGKIKFLSTNV